MADNANTQSAGITKGISMKEKIAYAAGDAGCVSVLGLVSALLQKYYTDVLYIVPGAITILFLVARIWDAINDPLWGRFIDTRRPTKQGRYRTWMLWMSIPLAVSAVLMFVKIPGLSQSGYLAYAYVTYILFGMMYTAVNIPYGSLASVMTANENDRSTLSIFRSVGSGLGGLPSMILASFCYVAVAGSTDKKMSYPIVIVGVIVISLLSLAFIFLCFKGTKERIMPAPKPKAQKGETKRILLSLLKSRPFIALCVASMLLIAAQMFTQAYYVYLFDYYFKKPALYMLVMVCTYLPIAVLMLFTNKLIKKVGKKALCAFGLLGAGLANLLLFFLQTPNVWVFLSLCLIGGFGFNFFILEVWAMVNDVIDYQEVYSGIREEATSYSFFSFTRKLGQTVAGVLSTQALVLIGYKTGENVVQDAKTISGMYNIAALVPAIMFLVGFVVLWFFYPLGKQKMQELQQRKEELYEEKAADAENI